MRVLLNATSSVVGGGIQVVHNYLDAAVDDAETEHLYVLSPEVESNLDPSLRQRLPNVHVLGPRPSRMVRGRASRRRLGLIEREARPDVVFTLFGPAYVGFSSPHLMAVADPWLCYHRTAPYFILGLATRLRRLGTTLYKRYWAARAQAWVFETASAATSFAELMSVSKDRVFVVPNSCRDIYRRAPRTGPAFLAEKETEERPVRVLVLSASYLHKNLGLVPRVLERLRRLSPRRFLFVFTLPPDAYGRLEAEARRLGVEDGMENVGRQLPDRCVELYQQSDVVFLPTLLEVFSANYPEAMCLGRPVVTSERPFAQEVCGDAAAYFDPLDAEAAARALARVVSDRSYARTLIGNGLSRLEAFPDSRAKYERYLSALSRLAAGKALYS